MSELFGGNEGRQVLDYCTKLGYGSREYFVNGAWTQDRQGQIRGFRFNIEAIHPTVEALAGIWRYIKEKSVQPPEKPDKVLEQLARALFIPEKLRIFSPWGPRYYKETPRIEEGDPEVRTIREMKEVLNIIKGSGFTIDFLLMPADLYGTEVNNFASDFVREYFQWVGEWACKELGTEVTVKPWSAIRNEQIRRYDDLRTEIDKNFKRWVKEGEYRTAVGVARRFSPERAEESARRYCIERLAEGNIISEVYDPIKVSLVKKEKDVLDGPLKRVYIIRNRKPWMGGE